MFCHNCGAKLEPGSQFCGNCGVATPEAQGAAPHGGATPPAAGGAPILRSAGGRGRVIGGPTQTASSGQESILGRKRPKGAVAVVAFALVGILLVVALAAAVVPTVVRSVNPKAYLAGCAAKTLTTLASETQKNADQLGIDSVLAAIWDGKMEQTMSLKFRAFPQSMESEWEYFNGSSISTTVQSDLKGRKLSADYSIGLGTLDLGSLRMFADDSLVSLSCPELAGSKFYGVNTETVGEDFDRNEYLRGAINPDVSFNYFDSIERLRKEKLVLTDETLKELAGLAKELQAEMEVKKGGKVSVEINDATEKLQQYTVTLPASAVRSWLQSGTKAVLRDDNVDEFLEYLFMSDPEDKDYFVDGLLEDMSDMLHYLKGDVTITVSIRKGYIAKAVFACKIDDVDTVLDLQIGNAKSAISGFTASLDLDGGGNTASVSLTTDNVNGDGGIYSTDGELAVYENGTRNAAITWSGELDSKGKSDNFDCSFKVLPSYGDNVQFQASGTVQVDKRGKSFSADLDRVDMTVNGKTLSMSAFYSVAPFKGFDFEPGDVKLLSDMSRAQLEDLEDEIEENAQRIYYGLSDSFYY